MSLCQVKQKWNLHDRGGKKKPSFVNQIWSVARDARLDDTGLYPVYTEKEKRLLSPNFKVSQYNGRLFYITKTSIVTRLQRMTKSLKWRQLA